jgi:hypothetical protein
VKKSIEAAARRPCFLSPALMKAAALPPSLAPVARRWTTSGTCPGLAGPLVVAFASELLDGSIRAAGGGAATRYLIVADVPEPALMRLPAALQVRRPDYRLYVTRDVGVVRRLLVSSLRPDPRLGIVDAYALGDTLVVLTGDAEIRSFPFAALAPLAGFPAEQRAAFDIDEDGAYLHWPAADVHLGASQLLQAVDPMFLADVEIARSSNDFTGRALRALREERGLRQSDVAGLSERQVRRIEDGISRLRSSSAESFAEAFGTSVSDLLGEIGRRAAAIRTDEQVSPARARPARAATRAARS